MTNIRTGDEFFLNLTGQKIIILLEKLRQAIEYSGRLRAFVVGGENLELCDRLELMWQKAESNRRKYKPFLSQITPDLEKINIESKPLSNGKINHSGFTLEKDEEIFSLGKPRKASVAITRIVFPGVEASLLVLGSQLNVWMKLDWGANQNNGISWGYAGSPNGNWQNAIEPEPPLRVSIVVEPEAIAQLLATPAVAAAIPHCSSLEAADLENDPNLLGRFWRQFQQIVPPDWEERPSREVGDRQRGIIENRPNSSSQKSLGDSLGTHLFSEAPIGIIYQSLDGGILAANPAFCRMIGYTKEQLRHLDLRSISHPEDFAVEVRLIQSLLQGGLKGQSLRKRYLRRNGSILATEISMSLVGEETEESYLMTFVKDLSDRALAEQELEQQREQEGILNEISAQIRSNQALPKILKLAVERVQQALNADRVLAYQIRSDRSGICVAEAVDPAYPATEGNVFPVDCIPSAYLEAYRNGRLWRADDVWASDLAQCHREMLSDLDARSIISVGIRYTNKASTWENYHQDSQNLSESVEFTAETVAKDLSGKQAASFQRDLAKNEIARGEATSGRAVQDNIALWGLLVVHHCHAPRRWTKIEEQLVQAVANQIGIAIEQTVILQKLQAYTRELEDRVKERTYSLQRSLRFEQLRSQITETFRNALDEDEVLKTAVDGLAETLRADGCYASLYREEERVFEVRCESESDKGEGASLVGERLSLQNHLGALSSGEVCFEDFPERIPEDESGDRSSDSSYSDGLDSDGLEDADFANRGSSLISPILDRQGLIGTICIFSTRPRTFSPEEIKLVFQIASGCAIAIRSARLAQQEHSSRANAKYFRSFIEQSTDVFAEYDSELRYLSINSAGALLLQLPPAQIIGKTNRELLGEHAADTLEPLIRQVFTTGETVRVTNEISFPGGSRTLDSVYAPITDVAGRVRRAIGVSKDVTELRDRCKLLQEKNEELTAMNRMKEDFITTTSHELRTPLTAILGFANVMLEGAFGELNSKQFDYIERIHNSGQHLLELINDILDLSRMEADRLEVEPQLIFIHDLCQSTISLIRERVANHGLNLEVEVAPDLEYMVVDYRRLKQMLLNLLGNAIKFTPEGTIGLKIYKTRGDRSSNHSSSRNLHSDWIHFMVWDTGIGIDEREQGRLFTPFSQIDSSLSRQYQGSGLGLTITRKLAELLGGYISLESDTNKGSSFTISLPLQEEPEALTGNWQ